MSAHHSQTSPSHATPTKRRLRSVLTTVLLALCGASTHAATITVNSLLDDVFPDAAGAISVPLTAAKCTLRMAIASANLDLAVGGTTNGCVAASGTTYLTAGADTIAFDPALANGTILLDATQAMNVGPLANNTFSILFVTGPTTIDGSTATNIALDGGSLAATTNKRIMIVAEVAPSSSESRSGSSIWANVYGIKFQNARVENSGGCLLSFENLRLFSVEFTNCISTNTPSAAAAAGGALFMRAADNNASSFRPDARLTRVAFRGNKALAGGNTSNPGGGAFFLGSGAGRMGNVVLTDVIVGGPTVADQNYADGGYGGGSITRAESVSVSNSTFQGNVAQNGEVGGLRIDNMGGEGTVTVLNSSFRANSAKDQGRALSITNNPASPVILRNLTISGNSGRGNVGLNLYANRSVVLSNSVISDNIATDFTAGMALENTTGSVEVDDVVISGNKVLNGGNGGFYIGGNTGAVTIRRTSIINNEIFKGTSGYAGNGAGNFYNNTNLTMFDSVVSGNVSDYHIGALAISASFSPVDSGGLPVATLPPTTNSFTLNRVAITNNLTTGASNGGAGNSMININSPGLYSILNSTIAGNIVTGGNQPGLSFGGFNPSTQTNATRVVIRNSTMARNTANGGEAVAFGSYNGAAPSSINPFNGSITIESSIIGGRQGAGNPTYLSYYAIPSGGLTFSNNLIENNGDAFTAQCNLNGNLCTTDAKLDALALHGGPTKTLRLLPGSPAINTGSNSTNQLTDQRGATRLQGAGVDMGAYETPAGSLTNCSLDMDGDSLVQANKEGLVLVRAMLGFSNANAVLGSGISQAQWAAVKANLNANCGTSFTP